MRCFLYSIVKVKIIADEEVDPEFGTGAVMVCTFGDKTDVSWVNKHNLEIIDAINEKGLLTSAAGRYEGIDERIIETLIDEEWSIGDYVLSGGELAAMVMIDAIARLIPGVLGDEDSAQEDSFVKGLLDYPQYTRPLEIDGLAVPEVLLSGNHELIRKWRLKQALGRTYERRPDLLNNLALTDEQAKLLAQYLKEHQQDA